uniref:DUF4332 domain-containing protein n=1 Tax=Candidatus Vondammii sp. HM_W22 TaxID=2687299 RepID=UPI002E7B7E63|nr:DUF4332 domain-containing protein [Candidatus Vondammii sp. HM_W22]
MPELAQSNVENLNEKLAAVAGERGNVIRHIPSQSEIDKWVARAKDLPRAILLRITESYWPSLHRVPHHMHNTQLVIRKSRVDCIRKAL